MSISPHPSIDASWLRAKRRFREGNGLFKVRTVCLPFGYGQFTAGYIFICQEGSRVVLSKSLCGREGLEERLRKVHTRNRQLTTVIFMMLHSFSGTLDQASASVRWIRLSHLFADTDPIRTRHHQAREQAILPVLRESTRARPASRKVRPFPGNG